MPEDGCGCGVLSAAGVCIECGREWKSVLTAVEAAELAGVAVSTWGAYVSRGHAPAPDGRLGNQRWWYRETMQKWLSNRPGRGARTDLR